MLNEKSNGRGEIIIRDLVKKFGDVTAVNGLNLEIRKGEMFGFLGPNGAGKTTTISILCGLLVPSAGAIQIARFTPNYYVSDSLSIIFQQGSVGDPTLWQNLAILTGATLAIVVPGILLFMKTKNL